MNFIANENIAVARLLIRCEMIPLETAGVVVGVNPTTDKWVNKQIVLFCCALMVGELPVFFFIEQPTVNYWHSTEEFMSIHQMPKYDKIPSWFPRCKTTTFSNIFFFSKNSEFPFSHQSRVFFFVGSIYLSCAIGSSNALFDKFTWLDKITLSDCWR